MHHSLGPRLHDCRRALVVAGAGNTVMAKLLHATLGDFGTTSTVLEEPTQQQLQQVLTALQKSAADSPWVQALYFYFTGRGHQHSHDTQHLQLLEVHQQQENSPAPDTSPTATPAAAAAAAAAAGNNGAAGSSSNNSSSSSTAGPVLVSPLQGLEGAAQRDQTPLLVQIDTLSSSCQPTQEQLAAFGEGAVKDRGSFSHRMSAMGFEQDVTLVLWSWLLYKHTFLVYHSTWAEAHAAAVADLRGGAGPDVPAPCFAADGSNPSLFPHGQVPEEYHRVLKLLHDVNAAATYAPRSNHTLHLLQQLSLLLADADWRPFVLRWGLLKLTAAAAAAGSAGGGSSSATAAAAAGAGAAAAAAAAAARDPLDAMMSDMSDLFAEEMKLPGALLTLAATDRPETQQAAAAVLSQLYPLTDYGVMPGEAAGKADAEGRVDVARRLLKVQLPLMVSNTEAAAAAGGLTAGGGATGGAGKAAAATASQQVSLPLVLLPFVASYVFGQGLEEELQEVLNGRELMAVQEPSAAAAAAAAGAATGDLDFAMLAAGNMLPPPAKRPRTGSSNKLLLQLQHKQQNSPYASSASGLPSGMLFLGPPSALLPPTPNATTWPPLTGPSSSSNGNNNNHTQQHRASLVAAGLLVPQQQQQQQEEVAEDDRTLHLRGVVGVGHGALRNDLLAVTATDLLDPSPLLHLKQLTKLTLSRCSSTAQQLMPLTSLTSLKSVLLHFDQPRNAAAAAPAWGCLPVDDLYLGGQSKRKYPRYATTAVLDGLNLCRQLTRLEFYCRMPHMRPTDLATCLAQRTSLVTLTISSLTLDDGGSQPGAVHGWRQLLRSIASLPRLQRLKLWGLTWNSPVGSVIHELAALSSSSLTHLELAYSAVNDSSALSIVQAPALRGLRHLDLSAVTSSYNCITDATMAVIATTLTALTELHIRGTMVTERGKQLVQLRLPGIDIVGDKK